MGKGLKTLPEGIILLRIFYLLNAIFCIGTVLLFHNEIGIMVLGRRLSYIPEIAMKLTLVALPLYMYATLRTPNPVAFYAVEGYHVIFILNNLMAIIFFMGKQIITFTPLVQIVNKNIWHLSAPTDMGYKTAHLVVHSISILISIGILYYISNIRGLFFDRSKQ